jgi:drug/metabolite transporter (DMT)-like permease
MSTDLRSALLILSACFLWAVDLLIRYPLTLKMSFVSIVFLESFLGLLFISPALFRNFQEIKTMKRSQWLIALFIGGVGMSAAGYLQTACIQKATPGLFSFFQIFQPLLVIFMARLFLKEKIDNMYVYWGVWVVLSAVLMFSVDLGLMVESGPVVSDMLVALMTTFIWGLCTIMAKKFLQSNSVSILIGLRCLFAFLVSSILLIDEANLIPLTQMGSFEFVARFFFMAVVAGIFSMFLYYLGLRNLPAGRVSFFEISYSAFGMFFSALYTFEGLTFLQLLGGASFFSFLVLFLFKSGSSGTTIGARQLPKRS